MRAHMQVKKSCNIGCFKRFSQSSNLTAHEKTHFLTKSPQNQPSNFVQKPTFQTNPLKMLALNQYSGSLHISNLLHINKLYEIMKEAIIAENNAALQKENISGTCSSHPFQITNDNMKSIGNNLSNIPLFKNKLFITTKGQKIFHIIKDNNGNSPNKKEVSIIYYY